MLVLLKRKHLHQQWCEGARKRGSAGARKCGSAEERKLGSAEGMKRIVNKSKDFKDAENYDILQHISMTPEERQKIAWKLKVRVYGKKCLDVRESRKFAKKRKR
jgi:hypothetical protein